MTSDCLDLDIFTSSDLNSLQAKYDHYMSLPEMKARGIIRIPARQTNPLFFLFN